MLDADRRGIRLCPAPRSLPLMTTAAVSLPSGLLYRRWFQLGVGVISMMAISSPQYVWTLFVKPLQTTLNASLAAIQVTFSVLIVVQTWLSPLQGYLIERFGVRALCTVGALLVAASWIAG